MRVVHIVKKLSGTAVPVEIANRLDDVPGVSSHIIAVVKCDAPPDIVDMNRVVMNGCRTADEILKFINDNEYDIVNTHHNVFSRVSRQAFVRLRSSRIRRVESQHGHIHYDAQQKRLNLISLFFCDALVYNSYATANSYDVIERLLMRNKPRTVIHHGVDFRKADAHRSQWRDRVERISVAARLIPRKNHITLLKAVELLEDSSIHLDLIGGGRSLDYLMAATRDLGIEERVTFHGHLKDKRDVYRIMGASDLFILPSHGEGFCLAVAEAMALGLPVIVSDLEVFHEVLGDNGVFVPPDDAPRLAALIRTMTSNPDLARELGQKNRERAIAKFDIARTTEDYRDFYASMLTARTR